MTEKHAQFETSSPKQLSTHQTKKPTNHQTPPKQTTKTAFRDQHLACAVPPVARPKAPILEPGRDPTSNGPKPLGTWM